MKKWLLATSLGLAMATSAQATDKTVIVNTGGLSQQVTQKTGVSATLENEFKDRTSEPWRMEPDLQSKTQRLRSTKAGSDRIKSEKGVMAQRQIFSQKVQAFEQDRTRHSSEERGKLVTHIRTAVKFVVSSQSIGLAVDTNTAVYNSSGVEDITADALEQTKQVVSSIRLADLAEQLSVELHGDGDIVITGVASI